MDKQKIKEIVKNFYGQKAEGGQCCCSCSCGKQENNEQIAKEIGYSEKELQIAEEANLGLGCGNPTGMADIKEGETVLDLGSGAGIDCFLAAEKTGETGKVIGVDMTPEMIERGRQNAEKYGYKNVEFCQGDIENLPVDDDSIDIVVSNCVINLVPDKEKVFQEAFRVLKKGGRMYVSDIVLLEDIAQEIKENEELVASCVGGALLKDDYLNIAKSAGFKVVILAEDKDISKKQYQGLPLESLKIKLEK